MDDRYQHLIATKNLSKLVVTASRLTITILMAVGLSACATIRGAQTTPSELRTSTPAESTEQALLNFHSSSNDKRKGLSPFGYRNYMIGQYSQRIETNYDRFVDQLNSGSRSSALGFDLLQLGLSGATGLVKQSAVEELSVASTLAAGTRASVDKRVFYDRTITALIASMDAERSDIKKDIAQKRKLPASVYAMEDAIDDLNRLVNAGSINRAFSRITRSAENEREAAEDRLNSVSSACDDINTADAALIRDFRLFIRASLTNLNNASQLMNVQGKDTEELDANLRAAFATELCGNTAKQEMLNKLTSMEAPAVSETTTETEEENGD